MKSLKYKVCLYKRELLSNIIKGYLLINLKVQVIVLNWEVPGLDI